MSFEIELARDTVHLVELAAAPVDLDPTYAAGHSPAIGLVSIGRFAVGVPATTGLIPTYDEPVEETQYFADRDWTTPAGAAAVFYDGRADQSLELERTIPLNPYSDSRSTFGVGRVALANADRGLRDLILNYSIDGRQIEVLAGRPTQARAAFTTIFKGLAEAWGAASASVVQIALRDRWRKLTTDPRPLFQGNGGTEGGSELTGKPMPLWLGRRSHVQLTLLTRLPFPILMASYKHMESLDEIDVRELALTIATTSTDIFAESAPAAGTCIVAPKDATGYALVGLGSEPDGPVTASGRGLYDGAYLASHGDIAMWLLEELGGVDPVEIDDAAWDAVSAAWSGEIGAWFGLEPVNVNQMVDAILGPHLWWGDTAAGLITAGALDLPANLATPQGTLSREYGILSIDRIDWPGGPPWKMARVAYDTNNFIFEDPDVDAAGAKKDYAKEPFRVFPLPSIPVRTAHSGAFDGDPVLTPYYDVNDAASVAQLLLRLNSGEVDLYRVETPDDRVRFPEGHVLYLDHPMVDDDPVPAVVIGTSLDARARKATYLLVA